jgi:uncharacterized lipoprotein YddW (UPF0748 family)
MGDDLKYGEAPGLPAVEHAKKRIAEKKAKAKAEREAKKTKYAKVFYTLIDSKKIIMLTVKPNGLYRSFFGHAKKLGPDMVKIQIKKWKEKNQWIEQGLIDDIIPDLIEKMQAEQAAEKKG